MSSEIVDMNPVKENKTAIVEAENKGTETSAEGYDGLKKATVASTGKTM